MRPETRKLLEEAERDADSPNTLPPLDESKVKYRKRLRNPEEEQYFN